MTIQDKNCYFFTHVPHMLSILYIGTSPSLSKPLTFFQQRVFATERSALNKWGISSFRGAESVPFCTVHSCQLWEWKPLVQEGSGLEQSNRLLISNQQKEHTPAALHSVVIQLIHDNSCDLHSYLSIFKTVKVTLMHCINIAKGILEATRVMCSLSM